MVYILKFYHSPRTLLKPWFSELRSYLEDWHWHNDKGGLSPSTLYIRLRFELKMRTKYTGWHNGLRSEKKCNLEMSIWLPRFSGLLRSKKIPKTLILASTCTNIIFNSTIIRFFCLLCKGQIVQINWILSKKWWW